MKRNEHLFQFTGQQIANAAESEQSYHADRLAWWRGERDRAVDLLRSTCAVEVKEQPVTGGFRTQVVATYDYSLMARVSEAEGKIDGHRKAADAFRIEAATYASNPTRSYELAPDDVMHFRLAGGERDA